MRVKICGTTSLEDALMSVDAGADAIGLIFAPVSRRRVTVEQAREISLALGPAVGRVGVFLDQPLQEVLRTAERARLSAVQIHGPLPGLYLETLARYHPVLRVLRAAELARGSAAGEGAAGEGAGGGAGLEAGLPPHVTLMLDAPQPGSGQELDWPALAGNFPAGAWLAGGLGPENVARAIGVLRPAGVDAVSRLERGPGVKDEALVRAFVREARAAAGALPDSYPQ
ncbi:MAG: phosphoribosylanthranilate isomerase [Deinococcus sp.]